MAKFYRMAWYEVAVKWSAMMHANAPKVLKLYKTSRSGKVHMKRVYSSDWKSADGYEPSVASTSEQEQDSVKTLQKFMFLLSQFPNNLELKKIAQKRMLESVDLTAEELKAIEEGENPQPQQVAPVEPAQLQPGQQQQPQAIQQNPGEIQDLISQLTN